MILLKTINELVTELKENQIFDSSVDRTFKKRTQIQSNHLKFFYDNQELSKLLFATPVKMRTIKSNRLPLIFKPEEKWVQSIQDEYSAIGKDELEKREAPAKGAGKGGGPPPDPLRRAGWYLAGCQIEDRMKTEAFLSLL